MNNHKIELLKQSNISKKTGKRFDNLYLRIDGGTPIQIEIVAREWTPKRKNFLLAMATDSVIKNVVLVTAIDDPKLDYEECPATDNIDNSGQF